MALLSRAMDGRLRPIIRMGHPVLRQRAVEAAPDRFGTRMLRDLGRDLVRTMHEGNGVGLAAPQIAVGLRAFAYYLPGDDADELPPRVLVNPKLTPVQLITIIRDTAEKTTDGRRTLIHPAKALAAVQ